jgi:DNA-binding transcriptional LysR family regulator
MSELLAFEAAARHGSFTLAAMELGITQGAISKAVGGLERFLRLRLFTRSGSRIVLTEAGRSYLAAVTPPIAAIESATRSVMSDGGAGGRLTIAAMPSFAERWILPRLPDFARLHPRVALSFAPYTRAGDLVGGIDCAVRYGYGEWPSTESYPLLGRRLIPIVAAGTLPDGAPRAPETVAGLPLISHFHFPDKWPTWFETHGLPRSAAAIGTTFDQYGMIVRAVVAGLGCAPRAHLPHRGRARHRRRGGGDARALTRRSGATTCASRQPWSPRRRWGSSATGSCARRAASRPEARGTLRPRALLRRPRSTRRTRSRVPISSTRTACSSDHEACPARPCSAC